MHYSNGHTMGTKQESIWSYAFGRGGSGGALAYFETNYQFIYKDNYYCPALEFIS